MWPAVEKQGSDGGRVQTAAGPPAPLHVQLPLSEGVDLKKVENPS